MTRGAKLETLVESSGEVVLRAEGLCYRYPGGVEFGPLEAALRAGLYQLGGANGSGKTTLLRCMAGELRASRGRCMVAGLDTWRQPAARAKIGYLATPADQPELLTIDELWGMMAALRGAPKWDGAPLRDALGLPGGLQLVACSAGQRHRAELLAALAGDPAVLLLDEPLATLDVASVAQVRGMLRELAATRVVVVTSHLEV
jgi:ABC-2 type transport system ATP-binding protein